MKLYKFTISAFLLIFILFLNCDLSLAIFNNSNDDKTSPTIKVITPLRSQSYIISRPTIKVGIYDKSGIKKSSLRIYVNNVDVTSKSKFVNNTITYTPTKKFKRGSQIIRVTVCDKFNNRACAEWFFVVGTPIYTSFNGCFLDINSNINLSTYDNLYKKHISNNKFCITSNNIIIAKKDLDLITSTSNKYYKNNEFVPINSFKFDMPSFSDQINIYNIKNLNSYKKDMNNSLNLLYKNLFFRDDIICQFNPKTKSLCAFNYMKYSYYGDQTFNLIDVTNCDKNSKDIFYLDLYNEALDNGWHLAPISKQYNTKILATNLTKDSIYDSLRNRRTYVSNNKNIKLEFNINNRPMGSIIKNSSRLNFCISVIDSSEDNNIKSISVVSNNNKIIKKSNFSSNLAKLDFCLDKFENLSYYYLVILQDNNKITVSAPIWIENK